MLSIDITDKQVKIVRGVLAGNKIRVIDADMRDLPQGSVVSGYIADIPMVASEITDMLNTKNIKEKEAIVCVNSSYILYKELMLPKPKKLTNSVAIEAMIQANMGISSEYNISYSITGEATDEEGKHMIKLMATACPQRMIDGYVKLFSHVGLTLSQINISNNCITRLILNSSRLEASMPLMLVQIDTDFLNINLYEDSQLTFSRYIKIDPMDYNNDPDYVNQAVYDNLFRMIQFTSSRKDAKPLKEIMFYGVINDFIALTNAISSFNVPAHILTMPNKIVTMCELDFSKYANAIGAFYKVNKVYDHVNLLQSSAAKEKKGVNTYLIKLAAIAAVCCGVVAGATIGINAYTSGIDAQTNAVNAEIQAPELQARLSELNNKIGTLTNYQSYLASIQQANDLFDNKPRAITDVLNKLEECLVDGMRITDSVAISEYSLSVQFECDDDSMPSTYVQALKDQGYFENIAYNGYTGSKSSDDDSDKDDKTYSFSLTMLIKGGNGVEAE